MYVAFFKKYQLFFICYLVLLFIGVSICLLTDFGVLILYFQQHTNFSADIIFYVLTVLFEFPYLLVTLLLVLIYSWRKLIVLLSSYIFASIIARILKITFNHPRPAFYFEKQEMVIHSYLEQMGEVLPRIHSFPSGHTTVSFALLSMLAFWSPRYLRIPLLILASLIGISRVYLACHFLEDILLGSFIGIFSSTVIHLLYSSDYIKRFRLGRFVAK